MSLSFRPLAVAIATLSAVSLAHSAGTDRSTQPSQFMIEPGTFVQVEYITIDPDVSGTDRSGNKVNDYFDRYNFVNFSAKTDITPKTSIGIYYDEPFGGNALHKSGQTHNFVDIATDVGSSSTVKSKNISAIVGVKLGEKNNFHVYGGPALQEIENDIHLRGRAYTLASGYDLVASPSTEIGWVAGVGYTKPEKGIKASLTYRSKIEHDLTTYESFPNAPAICTFKGKTCTNTRASNYTYTTPQSFNFDWQMGLNKTTSLSGKIRYVPWSDIKLTPSLYNEALGYDILSYDKDAWSGEIALGKRLSPKLGVSGSISYDSGTGEKTTSLGTVNGSYGVGVGARYNFTPNWAVSVGAKYLRAGDATARLPSGVEVGDFKDNSAVVYGLRLSYQKR